LATKAKSKGSKGKATKMQPLTVDKMTAAEARARVVELEEELENEKGKLWCHLCGKKKPADRFYIDTDPRSQSGYTAICKDCARRLAMRVDLNNEEHEPTKESCKEALFYLNRAFTDKLWDASIAESTNEALGNTKNNVWTSLVKNSALPQQTGLGWRDSDMFKEHIVYEDEKTAEDVIKGREDQDTYSDFLKNKADVVRLLSYDPFEDESISDQPFLYSQLLGLLDADESGNDDMMRTASCIAIVRNFLQQQKIDNSIATLTGDRNQTANNSATVKSLQESKAKIVAQIKDLAAESCISLKNSKNAKKGENTWTGKIKKIRDLNLRSAHVNGFDIQTCRGMQQVQELSDASIMKQLALDESEWSDMVAEMREVIVNLRNEKDQYKEINRILLQENLDLKDYLEENNMQPDKQYTNLKEIYSIFAAAEDEEVSEDADSK